MNNILLRAVKMVLKESKNPEEVLLKMLGSDWREQVDSLTTDTQ